MMEVGPPEKRARIHPPPQWHTSNPTDASRQLPPPPNFNQAPPPTQPYTSRPPDPIQPLSSLDRRHSGHNEHPYYDTQDPRRPPSGPSHGYLPPHPGPPPQLSPFNGQRESPRDPMIKRDPSEDQTHNPYGRSPSNHSDHNVNPHHAPPHDTSNRPYQHTQHGLPSYESPHIQQRNNSYPPQSPMAPPDQYHPSPYPRQSAPPQEPYPALAYPSANTPRGGEVKRKAQRAAQACDSCRTLKAKCDEGRPTCSTCSEKGLTCNYRDPPPKQPEKGSAEIIDAVTRLEGRMSQLEGHMSRIDRLESILQTVKGESITRFELMQRLDETDDRIQRVILNALGKAPALLKQESVETPALGPPAPLVSFSQTPALMERSLPPRAESGYNSDIVPPAPPEEIVNPLIHDEGSEEDDVGEPRAPKMPTIPVNHTTGAARLLTAPGIRELVRDIIGPNRRIKNERYPMTMEEKRGSLRLFGRGEGTESTPGYEKDVLNDHVSDSTPGDTLSDTSSPAPSGEDWGQIGGLTPPSYTNQEFVRGGISADGMPDFSREVVMELVKSYKDNINNMHPILAPRQLDAMVELFLKQLPESQARPKQVSNLFVANRHPESPGTKRKRSPGVGESYEQPTPPWDQRKPGHPFRSITSAIVLLVLALGKICLHKGKLPDVSGFGDGVAEFPAFKNGNPYSPMQSSPSMTTIPSPAEVSSRSRRTSMEGSTMLPKEQRVRPKNIDKIPGLHYFAFATDVIGNQLGGNKLQHVHACLLAGLYHGQLGRVLESHAYIHQACYSLEGILRKRFERLRKTNALNISSKDNPIVFAFWTCLQLESDIIAELPVPQSNILTYEDDMPHPNLKIAEDMEGFDSFMLESYTAQLFLRKHLNLLHTMFYKPETTVPLSIHNRNGEASKNPTIDALEAGLASMEKVAPSMTWNIDAGDRSSSILHARLRAKYYGAKVITYRPFLLKIMEVQRPARDPSKGAAPIEKDFKLDVGAPSVNPAATCIEDIDPKAIEYARKAIMALAYSTSAFHDVVDCGKQRLLVTNVWGTAHAQWGNLMTLQACQCDNILGPILNSLISHDELAELIHKTSAFLNFTATRSSALAVDNIILRHVAEKIGLLRTSKQNSAGPYKAPDTNSSFTSVGSGSAGEGPPNGVY